MRFKICQHIKRSRLPKAFRVGLARLPQPADLPHESLEAEDLHPGVRRQPGESMAHHVAAAVECGQLDREGRLPKRLIQVPRTSQPTEVRKELLAIDHLSAVGSGLTRMARGM